MLSNDLIHEAMTKALRKRQYYEEAKMIMNSTVEVSVSELKELLIKSRFQSDKSRSNNESQDEGVTHQDYKIIKEFCH